MIRPPRGAPALLLVAALLLAAGCVSQGSDNQTHTLPREKYVFLHHDISSDVTTLSPGFCLSPSVNYGFPYRFNEYNGVLAVHSYDNERESVNDSLILVSNQGGRRYYGRDEGSGRERVLEGGGWFVYSLPGQFRSYSHNVTLDSVREDGTVALHYRNESIVLKPKERWENITHRIHTENESVQIGNFSSDGSEDCMEDIKITDSLYNAGVFDKKTIVIRKR